MTSIRAAERRRQQSRAAARRAILEASEAILIEVGYDGFSIRRLVQRCGYSAPTIYHSFGDKTGLIDALLEERLSELVAELTAVPSHADPLVEVRARYRAFARWGIDHPSHYRLLMEPRAEDAPPLPSGEEVLALMRSPFERLAEVGRLPADDLEAIGQAAWACLHGLTSLPVIRPDVDWQPNLIERSLDAILRGWMNDADSSPCSAPERSTTPSTGACPKAGASSSRSV